MKIGFYQTKHECRIVSTSSTTRPSLPDKDFFKVVSVDNENKLFFGVFRDDSCWVKFGWAARHANYVGETQPRPKEEEDEIDHQTRQASGAD